MRNPLGADTRHIGVVFSRMIYLRLMYASKLHGRKVNDIIRQAVGDWLMNHDIPLIKDPESANNNQPRSKI
jgi:hypothetical protein